MKTKRYFYNLYKTFYSWRKKLISCCLVLLRNVFSWWRTEMRCMARPPATAGLHWILCVTTFHKLANVEQMAGQCFDSSKGSVAKLSLQLQNAPEAFFSLRVANVEVMIVESVRHKRARAGRVETSSFPGFFLFLSLEAMCRSFRSFSIPSRNPRHLIFWRLVWSISEQTGLNAPPNLFFVKDKISDHQKPMTWSNGLVRQWHFTLWPILKT